MLALAVVAALYLSQNPGGTIAVPVAAPSIFETLAERADGHVIRTAGNPAALVQAATQQGVGLAGGGNGTFIFPDFQPVPDALFAIGRIVELTAQLYGVMIAPGHYGADDKYLGFRITGG